MASAPASASAPSLTTAYNALPWFSAELRCLLSDIWVHEMSHIDTTRDDWTARFTDALAEHLETVAVGTAKRNDPRAVAQVCLWLTTWHDYQTLQVRQQIAESLLNLFRCESRHSAALTQVCRHPAAAKKKLSSYDGIDTVPSRQMPFFDYTTLQNNTNNRNYVQKTTNENSLLDNFFYPVIESSSRVAAASGNAHSDGDGFDGSACSST
jgi:hypothetical protein